MSLTFPARMPHLKATYRDIMQGEHRIAIEVCASVPEGDDPLSIVRRALGVQCIPDDYAWEITRNDLIGNAHRVIFRITFP